MEYTCEEIDGPREHMDTGEPLQATHEHLQRKIEQMEKRNGAKCRAAFASLKQMREVPVRRKKRSAFRLGQALKNTPASPPRHL